MCVFVNEMAHVLEEVQEYGVFEFTSLRGKVYLGEVGYEGKHKPTPTGSYLPEELLKLAWTPCFPFSRCTQVGP